MFNDKRSDGFKVRLNDMEKALLKAKAKQYGYKDIGTYMRDASLYENIYIENVEGKKEIMNLVSEYLIEIRKYNKKCEQIIKMISLVEKPSYIMDELKLYHEEISKNMNDIKQIISDKLYVKKEYVSFYTETQKKKRNEGNDK